MEALNPNLAASLARITLEIVKPDPYADDFQGPTYAERVVGVIAKEITMVQRYSSVVVAEQSEIVQALTQLQQAVIRENEASRPKFS